MAVHQRSRRTGSPTDYLFRTRITCHPCGLRMLALRRGRDRGYRCQPALHRGDAPVGHPPTVDLDERALLGAVADALAATLYQPEHAAYWQQTLAAPAPAVPRQARIRQLERSVTQTKARLRRQILAVEETDLDRAAQRAIDERVTALDAELTSQQEALARLRAQPTEKPPAAPATPVTNPPQAIFPITARELRVLPKPVLDELFVSLGLVVDYDHAQHTAHVSLLLPADEHIPLPTPPPRSNDATPRPRWQRLLSPKTTMNVQVAPGLEGERLRSFQRQALVKVLDAIAALRHRSHSHSSTSLAVVC